MSAGPMTCDRALIVSQATAAAAAAAVTSDDDDAVESWQAQSRHMTDEWMTTDVSTMSRDTMRRSQNDDCHPVRPPHPTGRTR